VQLAFITIQCQKSDGVLVNPGDDAGSPSVTLGAATIRHNGCAGVHALAGTSALSSAQGATVVTANHDGVVAENGIVTINAGSQTEIACNDGSEPGDCAGGHGVDVWQKGSGYLAASFVIWHGSVPPILYTCSPDLSSCTWTPDGGSLQTGAPPAEADLVLDTGATGALSAGIAVSDNGVCP
jgi:hypothetical protein